MKLAMQVVPPGSGGGQWEYKQPWNGRTLPFSAEDEDALIFKVRAFRAQNELDPTTVEVDIRAYIAGKTQPQKRPLNTLRERVTNWVGNRRFSVNEYVDQEVAEARAQLVVDCPYNKTGWGDDCVECTQKVFADSFAVRAGRETTKGKMIGACDICGWDNQTAVHLSSKSLKSIVQVKNPPSNACCMQWATKD